VGGEGVVSRFSLGVEIFAMVVVYKYKVKMRNTFFSPCTHGTCSFLLLAVDWQQQQCQIHSVG
jgi:hypothetical protein